VSGTYVKFTQAGAELFAWDFFSRVDRYCPICRRRSAICAFR